MSEERRRRGGRVRVSLLYRRFDHFFVSDAKNAKIFYKAKSKKLKSSTKQKGVVSTQNVLGLINSFVRSSRFCARKN